jgi:hypothetical protein
MLVCRTGLHATGVRQRRPGRCRILVRKHVVQRLVRAAIVPGGRERLARSRARKSECVDTVSLGARVALRRRRRAAAPQRVHPPDLRYRSRRLAAQHGPAVRRLAEVAVLPCTHVRVHAGKRTPPAEEISYGEGPCTQCDQWSVHLSRRRCPSPPHERDRAGRQRRIGNPPPERHHGAIRRGGHGRPSPKHHRDGAGQVGKIHDGGTDTPDRRRAVGARQLRCRVCAVIGAPSQPLTTSRTSP